MPHSSTPYWREPFSFATAALRAVLLQPHCSARGASCASSSAGTSTALPLILRTVSAGLRASVPALSTLLPPLSLLQLPVLLLLAKLRCWGALKAQSCLLLTHAEPASLLLLVMLLATPLLHLLPPAAELGSVRAPVRQSSCATSSIPLPCGRRTRHQAASKLYGSRRGGGGWLQWLGRRQGAAFQRESLSVPRLAHLLAKAGLP